MSEQPRRRVSWVSLACLAAAVLIVAVSWFLAPKGGDGEAFAGTDATVVSRLEESGARPWFEPLFSPGSAELESGLFALQAAAGAGVLGYALGRLHERRRARPQAGTAACTNASTGARTESTGPAQG